MTIAALHKTTPAEAAWNYWRGKIMLRKTVLQVLLLLMFVLLPACAGAQSTRGAATSSANTGSSSAASAEQQEMRDELRALRAEVERLRAEVEQQKSTPASKRVEPAAAATGAGPNVPSATASNFANSILPNGLRAGSARLYRASLRQRSRPRRSPSLLQIGPG